MMDNEPDELRVSDVVPGAIDADIGTSSGQWDEKLNPTDEPDVCRYNHVYNNYIKTKVTIGDRML